MRIAIKNAKFKIIKSFDFIRKYKYVKLAITHMLLKKFRSSLNQLYKVIIFEKYFQKYKKFNKITKVVSYRKQNKINPIIIRLIMSIKAVEYVKKQNKKLATFSFATNFTIITLHK